MSTSSPHLLHLLGRWQDTRLVFEAIPNRLDFFKNNKKEPPSIVINRLEICKTANHIHFPTTETAEFPSHPIRNEERPELEHYNWQPWLRENRLWNWNLEEEFEEQPQLRRRRQAPIQEEAENTLTGHNNLIKLICRDQSLKAPIKKPYSFFATALVNQTWSKKIIPLVQDHFQYVWDDTQTWNVEMQKLGDTNFYKVVFVVPPYCKVFFSDVSVMQALGFDSVGLGFQKDKFSIRSHKQKSGLTSYFWHNNSSTARTYTSLRPIENLPIYKLRIEAKKARQKLDEEARTKSPEILHEREELDTTFDTTYEYYPANMEPIHSEFLGADKLQAPANPADNVVLFENYFQFLFNHLARKQGIDPEVFKVTSNEPDPESVIFTYTRTTANRPDRLTVEIEFGEETRKIFKYVRPPYKLEWNLGRHNPYQLQVVELSGQKKRDFDRAESQRRAAEKKQKADAVARDTLAGKPAQVQDPKPKIAPAADVLKGQPAEIQDPQPKTPPKEKKPTIQTTTEIAEPTTPTVIKKTEERGAVGGTPAPTAETEERGAAGGTPAPAIETEERGAAGGAPKQTEEPGAAGGTPAIKATAAPEDIIKLNVRANIGEGTTTGPAAAEDIIRLNIQANVGEGGGGTGTTETEELERQRAEQERQRQEEEELERQRAEQERQRQEEEEQELARQREAQEELDRQREEEEELERQRGQNPEEGGDPDTDDDEPNPNPAELPPEGPEQEPFMRERKNFLVGNASRKRRWPGQQDANTLPNGLLLVLENALQENDFITDYGRCCVAATIFEQKVVTKNKCYLNLDFTEQISFQVFDSQHLSLVKVPNDQLVKIEILLYA